MQRNEGQSILKKTHNFPGTLYISLSIISILFSLPDARFRFCGGRARYLEARCFLNLRKKIRDVHRISKRVRKMTKISLTGLRRSSSHSCARLCTNGIIKCFLLPLCNEAKTLQDYIPYLQLVKKSVLAETKLFPSCQFVRRLRKGARVFVCVHGRVRYRYSPSLI